MIKNIGDEFPRVIHCQKPHSKLWKTFDPKK